MIKKNSFSKHSIYLKLLAFYFVLLVFGTLNIGTIGSLLKIFAFLPAFWWLITKNTIGFSRPLVAAMFFLGFSTISLFWSIDVYSTLVGDIGLISLLILLCASSGYKYSAENILFLKKALIWSSRITALAVLFIGGTLEYRFTLTDVLKEDPNYLNAYFLFGVVNAIECILSPIKYYRQIVYLLELGVYLLLVFASGSRGGAVAIIFAIFISGLGSFLRNKISIKTLFVPMLLGILVFLLVFIVPYILPQEVLQRFYMQNIIESKGTGRYQLWQDYWNVFITSPFWRQLIGYGKSVTFSLARDALFVRINVAHNILIEHLVSVGIIGLFLYFVMIWQFIKAAFLRHNIFALSVLGGVLMLSMSTSFGGKVYWNILIFIICLTNLSQPVIKENK